MSLFSRLRGIRKRWWVIAGVPAALVLAAGLFLLVRWVQYRAYQNVDLVAILPDDAQAAVHLADLSGRWPALSKSPALVALARVRNPERGDGALTFGELAQLAGTTLPPEVDDARILQAAGRDAAVAVQASGGRRDVVAATRVPFLYFLAEPILRRTMPEDLPFAFRGDILIVGTRSDWVQAAAARADSGERGRVALELEAAAPEGDPSFWIDLAAARKDPSWGAAIRDWFNAVPVREGLFMLELDSSKSLSGRLTVDGSRVTLQGELLLSEKLAPRLQRMYAMPPGDSGLVAFFPANTCYATGGKVEAETSWEFMRDLTRPRRSGTPRKTLSEGFGDFVSNLYVYMHDGISSAEEHRTDQAIRELFDRDAALLLTAEQEDPFLGITVLARVTDGPRTMETLFEFFTWLHDDEPDAFSLKSETYRNLDVRVLEGRYDILGAGIRPAFAVMDGILVLSSSYATLKAIADVRFGGAPGFRSSPGWPDLMAAAPADGPAWAYADAAVFGQTLMRMKDSAAKTQVARKMEAEGTARVRARLTDVFRKEWQRRNPGGTWVASEHVEEIDNVYRKYLAEEEEAAARDLEGFARRLIRLQGLAFTVRQGKGEALEWKALLTTGSR